MKRPSLLLSAILLSLSGVLFAADQKYRLKDIPTPEEKNRPEKKKSIDGDTVAESNTLLASEVAEEFYQQGMTALNEGNMEQAEGYFDRALILIPSHKGAKEGIEKIMQTYEQPKEVKTPTDNRAELVKKLEATLDKKFAEENLEDAESAATEILAIDPQHKGAKQKLIALNKKLYERALVRADEREQAEDYQGAIDALQVALTYRKDPALRPRIQELRAKISAMNLEKSDRLYIEALSANQTGNTEDALKLCRRALVLNPNNLQAKRMLERLSPKVAP